MIYSTLFYWILIEAKHIVCDYVLQNEWLHGTKRQDSGWMAAMLIHAAINAAGSFLVVLLVTGNVDAAFSAFFFEWLLHGWIDRLKLFSERFLSGGAATILDQLLHQACFVLIFIFWVLPAFSEK